VAQDRSHDVGGYARSVGLGAFALGLAFARSSVDRSILNRWSLWLFLAILVAVALFVVSVLVSMRGGRSAHGDPRRRLASATFDGALLLWGTSYLLSAFLEPDRAARILDLSPLGAETGMASLFEWAATMSAAVSGIAALTSCRVVPVGPLLVGSAIVMASLLAEGVARARVAIAPTVTGFPTASSRVWTRRFVSLNSEGFRDVEHVPGSGADRRRLLVVGDSVAFGWGLREINDRFGERLAIRLPAVDGPWEAINAARPDTATPEHLEFLQSMSRYHPDVAVLLYVFNDIDYLASVTPRVEWSPFSPVALSFKNSYLFQALYVRIRAIMRPATLDNDPYLDGGLLARHLADVSRFVDRSQELGALALVVPINVGIVAEPTLRNRYDAFFDAARSAGIPLCSLAHTFDGESLDAVTVNDLDRHPNERAHELAAVAVARCLESRLP